MSDTFMTREEVADRLGVTVAEIRRRQKVGTIPTPKKKGVRGELLWRRDDIEEMALSREQHKAAATYTSEQASLVFDAFEKGLTEVQCVISLKIPPVAVKELRAAYASMLGGLYLSSEQLKEINNLEIDGPFPIKEPKDLLRFMKEQAEAKCAECHKRPRLFCKSCVADAIKVIREKTKEVVEGTDGL